jgi:hypothetical protein
MNHWLSVSLAVSIIGWQYHWLAVLSHKVTLGMPVVPLCSLPTFFKTCFYESKLTVLMRAMVFDNFQKVWGVLGHLLNFSKISSGPPFAIGQKI